jgi:hypothetical protein
MTPGIYRPRNLSDATPGVSALRVGIGLGVAGLSFIAGAQQDMVGLYTLRMQLTHSARKAPSLNTWPGLVSTLEPIE